MSSTNPGQRPVRRWRVAVSVGFPGRFVYPPGEDPTKGPPSRLIPASRFAGRQSGKVGDYVLTLDRDANGPPMTIQSLWEPLLLTLDVEAVDPQAALDVTRAPVERVLDDFMFRLQMPVPVGQVNVIDATPPVAIGQERDFHISGPFPRWKFFASNPMDNQTEVLPRMRDDYPPLSNSYQRSVDWYVKGLNASFDADRFMFFWVALELVEAGRDARPRIPYRASCGHEIPTCPVCNTPTDKLAAGASIQEYLRELLGVSAPDARKLWDMRQMVHGASDLEFGSTKMNDLPDLVQLLRSAVTRALKEAMGINQADPPTVPEQSMWFAQTGLGGRRGISEDDLR